MTDRAACLRRRPRAPDVAPGGNRPTGVLSVLSVPRWPHDWRPHPVFNAARKALTTVLTGALPGHYRTSLVRGFLAGLQDSIHVECHARALLDPLQSISEGAGLAHPPSPKFGRNVTGL